MMNERLRRELGIYVKENLSKGYSLEDIKGVLIKSGVDESFVNEIVLVKEKSERLSSRKELDNYIKENLSKGYHVKAIKDVLVKSKLGEDFVDRNVRNYMLKNVLAKPLLIVVLVSLISFLFLLRLPPPIGLAPLPPGIVTITESYDFTDYVNLTLDEGQEYIWEMMNKGYLTSVKLSGAISKGRSARAYLEHDDNRYLIFDSSMLSEGEIEDEVIVMGVQEKARAALDEVFEFDAASEFEGNVSYSKVCTMWELNLELVECYGNEECCGFWNMSSRGVWNDTFYLSYGRYNSGLENVIKAQVIYYDVNLSVPYSNIVLSDVYSLEAEFYEARIEFSDVCVESCLLPSFDADSYRLVFEIEDGSLRIDSIGYTVKREVNVSLHAPVLVKEFENITIYKDYDYWVELSSYFYDEDDSVLSYSAYEVDNISLVIKEDRVQILPDYNFTGKRFVYFVVSDGYYNISSNVFSVDVVEEPLDVSEVEVSEEVVKPKVVINRPVKWVKKVNVSAPVFNLSVDISNSALNVSVRDVKNDKMISPDKLKVNDKGVIKSSGAYRDEKRVEQIDKLEDKLAERREELTGKGIIDTEEVREISIEERELRNEKNRLTGYAVGVGEGWFTMLFELVSGIEITAYAVVGDETSNVTSVIIEEIVSSVEVEYYTEGPYSEEEDISGGKRVFVSSDVHYEDILAYTYLDDVPESSIRVYRVDNGRELVSDVSYYDENNNGLIDYIEWVIPSLSNATYEIIYITKADHLNSSREFVADIYEYVKELDGNWSPVISSGEYVRVTFEIALDSTKDITIYARSNSTASIEVYTEGSDELVTTFENVSSEDWYKVYLTSLNGSHDTFDLKVIGEVEFDYIVDPIAYEPITNKTYKCGILNISNTVFIMNQSIENNTLTTPCINISAQNVTLDCNGKYIKSTSDEAGIYSNQLNTTIKNCNVSMKDGASGGYGIYLDGANNSYIYNNTLNDQRRGLQLISTSNTTIENNTAYSNSAGIALDSSSNNSIINNVANDNSWRGIYLYGNSNNNYLIGNTINNMISNYGIVLSSSSNNILINNTLNLNYQAIYLFSDSNYNTFINNILSDCTSDSAETGCLDLSGSNNNVVSGGIINNALGSLIYAEDSDNNVFQDLKLTGTSDNDVFLTSSSGQSTSANNTFLNVSYNISKENIDSDSQLIRKWYYRANVTNGVSPIGSANISAYDVFDAWQFNLTSDSSGYTNITEIIDYVNYEGTRNYYSNYTIDTSKGSMNNSHELNVSWEMEQSGFSGLILDDVVLEEGNRYIAPNIGGYNANGSVDMVLVNNTAYTSDQYIYLIHPIYGKRLEIYGEFSSADVNLSGLVMYLTSRKSVVDLSLATGIRSNHTLFLPYNNNNRLYVCPDANRSTDVNSSCTNVINFSRDELNTGTWTNGVRASIEGGYIKVENLTRSGIGVTGCMELNAPNTVNNLTDNIEDNGLTGACIDITAQNVTLDCKGYYIKSDNKVIGIYSDQVNTTIKNCNISMSILSGGYGIKLENANNSYIFNNTLKETNRGLWLGNTYYAKIEQNQIILNNYSGIDLFSSNNNTLIFNNMSQTIEGAGISITGTSGNNNLINNIINFNALGIQLAGSANNNFIINNTISFSYEDVLKKGVGIWISSNLNQIVNNTISFNIREGISLKGASNNTLINNKIFSNAGEGILFSTHASDDSLNNNIINNNIWNCSSVISNGCIALLSGSDNNVFSGGIINFSGSYLIRIGSSENNTFKDIQLFESVDEQVYVAGTSLNNTFLNITYNISKEFVDANSELIRKWYYQANVTYNNLPVENANVSAYNVTGIWQFNMTSKAGGYTDVTEIIDYINYGGNRNYYSNYTVNTSKDDLFESHELNVSWEMEQSGFSGLIFDDIVLEGDITPPAIEFKPPTPINNTNTTNTSVEINISIFEENLHIFKWNWNGTNYTFYDDSLVLMMNFDNVSALGEQTSGPGNKTVDVSRYGNDGVIYGANWTSSGKYGGAFEFDGIEDYINVSDDSSLDPSTISIGFWFKPDDNYNFGSNYASFVYDNDYEVYIENGNMVFVYKGDTLSSIKDTWDKGEWYYILATYDGVAQILYINGENESTAFVTAPFIIKNSLDEDVAWFFNSGDIVLKGTCSMGGAGTCDPPPADDAFIIQDASGTSVAYIDTNGNLCIEAGNCLGGDDCSGATDGFIVKNADDEVASYIDSSGGLCFTGGIIENGDL